MTGPKLNENVLALAEGQRSTKAVARHVRGSATKVRVVLDLIRGLDVRRADEVLQFSDRAAAAEVRNVLASAVANAIHNDNQDADELFVLAAFADEGPTLKRFRPRARGRASRIRKRTTHITVVVARMSDERLEVVQNRQTASAASRRRPGLSATSRAERVARSRQRAEGLRSGAPAADEAATDEVVADEVETDAVTADAVETDEMETDEITADHAAAEETVTDAESADVTDAVESSSDKAETGEGSANDESQASASEPLNEDGDEPDPTTSEAQRSEEGN